MTRKDLEELRILAERMKYQAQDAAQEKWKAAYIEDIASAQAKAALGALQKAQEWEMQVIEMAEKARAEYEAALREEKR